MSSVSNCVQQLCKQAHANGHLKDSFGGEEEERRSFRAGLAE
jgi:hypothetical protein